MYFCFSQVKGTLIEEKSQSLSNNQHEDILLYDITDSTRLKFQNFKRKNLRIS